MRMLRGGMAVATLGALLVGAPGAIGSETARQFVLSPEGNHLWAYDAATGDRQLVVRAVNGGDPGEDAPNGTQRDINGQICVSPDGTHVVTGEDTVIAGGSSHDPDIAGWGYFTISGGELGEITVEQTGKLSPGEAYAGDPDNFGCAFLDDDRLLTTAIGDPFPGQPANGQLFLWFGPFEAGFAEGDGGYVGDVAFCVIDDTLATAGGIAVDGGDVYVATNRPGDDGTPSGVWRFEGAWPQSPDECETATVERTRVIPAVDGAPFDPRVPTPSAVALSPRGTLYVSSVFSGTVAEFTTDGEWVRDVFPLSPVTVPTGPTTQTPFGLAVTADDSLWIADLGILVAQPAPGAGSLIRVGIDEDGHPAVPYETVQDGLTFPDGLGVYTPPTEAEAGTEPAAVECDWPMYGQNSTRTFALPDECASPITRDTVARLVPAWFLDTEKPVTASPVVVDGVVYVGSWERIMYALDAETGAEVWTFEVPEAPGATYGPIVSSAAVAEGLVLFGAGPHVFALDAATGEQVWDHDASAGVPDTPTEYESSPLVHGDVVLIGRDTHNEGVDRTGGVRGGLVALDLHTGAEVWTFEPEQERTGAGCGGMWSSPTLNAELGYVYMGTANCPNDEFVPWTPYVNAVTAVDLATGDPVWSFQPSGPPDDDTDFGATPNLFVDATGRQVLGAGKKDGTYYALDPATGALLWETHVADPAPNIGGFIGSPAAYHGNVFGGTAIGQPPYFHSLDGVSGEVRFQSGVGPTYGATAVVNGVAFNAALDDLLKAYDTDTGEVLWAAPLAGPGSSGPAVSGDMVFVGSGTSTSDACAKDNPTDDACVFFFDQALAQLGGVHAFRLL